MEPLTPNDPLWNLLGKSRSVEPRPNFLQNVVREARQTPQERGLLASLRSWWSEAEVMSFGMRAMTAVVAAGLLAYGVQQMSGPFIEVPAPVAVTEAPAHAEIVAVTPVDDFVWSDDFFGSDAMGLEAEPQSQQLQADATAANAPLENLLAVQDTYTLTDRELAILLY